MTNRDFLKQKLASEKDPELRRYALRRAEVLFDDNYLDKPTDRWTNFMIVPFINDMRFSVLESKLWKMLGIWEEEERPTLTVLPGGRVANNLPRKRDDISTTYFRILLRGISAVIHTEVVKLRETDFALEEVYGAWILKPLRRVNSIQWQFGHDIIEATSLEVGIDFDPERLAGFRQSYIETFNLRYISSHQGQLSALPSRAEIEARLDKWLLGDQEAIRKATDERVRLNNSQFRECVFSRDMSVYWRTRGDSCDLCNSLSGKTIGKSDPWFVPKMGKVHGAKGGELTSFQGCGHPPLHRG